MSLSNKFGGRSVHYLTLKTGLVGGMCHTEWPSGFRLWLMQILTDSQFVKRWDLFFDDSSIIPLLFENKLLFVWIIGLVQLSHYITTALWWETYSTPTQLSFEPTGFVLGAPSSLTALRGSKSPQPLSATLVSNYHRLKRWGRTVPACVCVCDKMWACTKGLAPLTCRKEVTSVITISDNNWFSHVWMGVWIAVIFYIVSSYRQSVYLCACVCVRAPSQYVTLRLKRHEG